MRYLLMNLLLLLSVLLLFIFLSIISLKKIECHDNQMYTTLVASICF